MMTQYQHGNPLRMHKAIKIISITLLILALVGVIMYAIGLMSFQGMFDKKYTREELTQYFINHEQEFSDVVNYFKSNIPQKNDYSISFWRHGKNKVSLLLYPDVIDPKNKIIGASDVSVDSPKLDTALSILGWSRVTLTTLRDKLKKTNCNYIANFGYNDSIVKLSPHQTGWGSFTYTICNKPIVDSLISIYGRPLGNDSFAIKVVLHYSSAL